VSGLSCSRRRAAWFVEACHEPVEVEAVQQVEIHERQNESGDIIKKCTEISRISTI
jgi:hypothetical protein